MNKKSIGFYIIASAVIWGVVSIGCAFKLRGTGLYADISLILVAGAIFHLLFIWVPMAAQYRKMKENISEKEVSQS